MNTMNVSKRVVSGAALILLMAVAVTAGAATKSKAGTKGAPPKSATTKVDPAKLLDPSKLTAKAPDVFSARFETSKGPFVVEVHRAWSPHGADRFYNLVSNGYYDDVRFFRVVSGFMAQVGIHCNPAVNKDWQPSPTEANPAVDSDTRCSRSFAT